MLRTLLGLGRRGYKQLEGDGDEEEELRVVMSSTAGAAEHMGSSLGEFLPWGTFAGRPAWRQRDSELEVWHRKDLEAPEILPVIQGVFLYSRSGKWMVSSELGGALGSLVSHQDSASPPHTGWQYACLGQWRQDLTLTLRPGGLQPAPRVELRCQEGPHLAPPGPTWHLQGTYTLTSRWSRGRPVYALQKCFFRQPVFLKVSHRWNFWSSPNSWLLVPCWVGLGGSKMVGSRRATSCPGDQEAGWGSGEGGVTVTRG